MNGPEHYREAERLIGEANHIGHLDPQRGDGFLRAAQVHATLAQAAATAMNDAEGGMGTNDWDEWRATVSVSKSTEAAPGQHDESCACDHHGDHLGCLTDCECGGRQPR